MRNTHIHDTASLMDNMAQIANIVKMHLLFVPTIQLRRIYPKMKITQYAKIHVIVYDQSMI